MPLLGVAMISFAPAPVTGHADAPRESTAAADAAFLEHVNDFFDQYCNSCHNSEKQSGGVPLDIYKSIEDARKDRKMWETINRVVSNGEMPPKKRTQPEPEEKAAFLTLVDDTLIKVNCVTGPKNPGRVTMRRLNRSEYNNTIRDLCGVDFKPADDFPSDDVGYGFDNIGDVLSMPPILLEKYLLAADRIFEQALQPVGEVKSSKQKFGAQNLVVVPRKSRQGNRGIQFTTEGSASLQKFNFPVAGEYILRVRTAGTTPDSAAARVVVRVDGREVAATDVQGGSREKPIVVEGKFQVESGEKRVAAVFANPSDADKLKPGQQPRMLSIFGLEIEGPINAPKHQVSASTKIVLSSIPETKAQDRTAAADSLRHFARRAFRRPVTDAEINRLLKLYDQATAAGDDFGDAIKLPLKAVLVSPHFLFRVEAEPPAGQPAKLISEHELATRLSYFLWSSMPDAELSALADRGELRKSGVLEQQIRRMLADPKSTSLVDNFAGQWLQLRNLRTLTPDTDTFQGFDESLKQAMIRESELFFEHIVKNDRPVTEFLDSDYTFLNDRLSWHYSVPDIKGPEFRYVKLTNNARGGIITQASLLTVTSNPTRTSPVKRGKWIYENILGLQAPPVPPGVPELQEGKLHGTLRQQMEQHRANPSCAGCHAKLDPLGFGLENFDGVGKYRWQENKINIDASGVLPEGETFNGPAELRKVLLGKADMFRKCLAEKLLTYALGRGLEYYDKCALDAISDRGESNGDKFSALVLAIVETDAFQKRKGMR